MDGKATFVAWILSTHNLPTDRARDLFKPSEEAESLLDYILKIQVLLGFNIFGVTSRLRKERELLDDVIRA